MDAIINFNNEKLIRISNYNSSDLILKVEWALGYNLSDLGKSNIKVLHTYNYGDIDDILLLDIYSVRYKIKHTIVA